MKPAAHILQPKRNDVAIAFSSKERMAFSRESIEPLLAENAFDLFWIDGSNSEEGRALPFSYTHTGRITEIHTHVGGGADAAILYALSLLLERGYAHIGLVENDVKLLPHWWQKTFGLFARGAADGLNVGAVSARCHGERIFVPRDDYAVMFNLGAGMILLTRQAVECVLDSYRTGCAGEVSFLFSHYTGVPLSVPWQVNDPNVAHIPEILSTGDWMFETSFLPRGLVALAPTPTLAHNLDDPHRHPLQETATQAHLSFDWRGFCGALRSLNTGQRRDSVQNIIPHYNPVLKQWRAFPHQLAKAIPAAFSGAWRARWSKFMGPFGFETCEAGAKMILPVHGITANLLLDGKKQPFSIRVNNQVDINMDGGQEWETAHLRFAHSGPHLLELAFSRPHIMLGMMQFEGPQPWFSAGYALRYADLARYIEKDA